MRHFAKEMGQIKELIYEMSKRGMYATSTVPISLAGCPPKRSETLGRHRKEPKSDKDIIPVKKLLQPQFSLLPSCTTDARSSRYFAQDTQTGSQWVDPSPSSSSSYSQTTPMEFLCKYCGRAHII